MSPAKRHKYIHHGIQVGGFDHFSFHFLFREYEYKVLRLLRRLSLGVPIIMTFSNGFCMNYVHGQHFTWSDDFYKDTEDEDDFIRWVSL